MRPSEEKRVNLAHFRIIINGLNFKNPQVLAFQTTVLYLYQPREEKNGNGVFLIFLAIFY